MEQNEPASHVANFGAPVKKALELSKFGYASIEAAKKIATRWVLLANLPRQIDRRRVFRSTCD